jgi:hypothetical protein
MVVDRLHLYRSKPFRRTSPTRTTHEPHLSQRVVVWLGEESEDTDAALDLINLLNEINNDRWCNERLLEVLHQPDYSGRWIAFRNFFLRRWWTRVWTIQEFVVPANIIFWCGHRHISRDAIFAALCIADRCNAPNFKGSIAFHHAFNRRRAWLLSEAAKAGKDVRLTLLALAAYFCNNEATDDRDRLYGFTGLCTEMHGLEINYAWSVEEVYLNFAKSFILTHRSLDILCFAALFKETSNSCLPSWVPDWRVRIQPLVVPSMASQSSCDFIGNLRPPRLLDPLKVRTSYSSSGLKTSEQSFEGSTLLAKGITIDVVANIAGAQVDDSTPELVQKTFDSRSADQILLSICSCLVLNRGDRYLEDPMPTELFYRDFIGLCLLMSTSQHLVESTFREWYRSISNLQFGGRTLEEIVQVACQGSNDISSGDVPSQEEYIQDSFYGRFHDVVKKRGLNLITGHSGRIGMASTRAIHGDIICILYGCSVPLLLRKDQEDNDFTVVGECFLDGCMEGEALLQDAYQEQTFRIV